MTNPPKRHALYLSIERRDVDDHFVTRTISEDDTVILGHLMFESYKGTIDYDGESLEDSVTEMRGTLNGKYGRLLHQASFVIEHREHAAAAVIFTWHEKEQIPLLTFTMTHPSFKNQGMSTYLITKGLNTLLDLGHENCFLVVTEGNQPAQSIYEKLGFKPK